MEDIEVFESVKDRRHWSLINHKAEDIEVFESV